MDSIENDDGGGGDGEPSSTYRAFARAMETVGVVSVAGFGGALAGVGVARRRAAVLAAAARGGRRRRRRRPDPDLPVRWAATCAGFASVVEIARVVSPAGAALRLSGRDGRAAEAIATVGDAVVGGAFAGAAFRGASPASDRRRRPVAVPGVGAARGAVPGAALGLAAGAARWSLSEAQRAIDEELSRETTTTTTTTTEEHRSDYERRLETMSVEQLTEELRRTREENDADDDEDRPPRTDDPVT